MIKKSNVFVFLDNVKFEKSSWQMRNRIKTITNGKDDQVWIRIPTTNVEKNTEIKDVLIDNTKDWSKKHVITLENNYGKNFLEIDFLNDMYRKKWFNLVDFNIEFIQRCCNFLEIKTKLIRSSKLKAKGKKGELVLNICRELKATQYLANPGSKEYLQEYEDDFNKIGIEYNNFIQKKYAQKGEEFVEKLSILDLIFNEKNNAKKFL
jgi:hypothetical protein